MFRIQRHLYECRVLGKLGTILAFQLFSCAIIKKGLHGAKVRAKLPEGVKESLGFVYGPVLGPLAVHKRIIGCPDNRQLRIFLDDIEFRFHLLNTATLAGKHETGFLQYNFSIDNLDYGCPARFGW
jgi:hypothetical protein